MVRISAELVAEAIASIDVPCKNGCVHADGVMANLAEVYETIIAAVACDVKDKSLAIYSAGLHLGYRIHQLEMQMARERSKDN